MLGFRDSALPVQLPMSSAASCAVRADSATAATSGDDFLEASGLESRGWQELLESLRSFGGLGFWGFRLYLAKSFKLSYSMGEKGCALRFTCSGFWRFGFRV